MDRQLAVLDAALVCVARVGVAKTTLDDVAREAGCARATVYRCFPNKAQLLAAVVEREVARLEHAVLAAALAEDALGGAAAAAMTTAARKMQEHRALAFVAAYEPELLLPHLAFEHEDAVLRRSAALVGPAFERFLPADASNRLGEWIARMTLSYLCDPSDDLDIRDAAQVLEFVDTFVIPGFVQLIHPQGVSS